jgi:hypothetical protein
MMPFLFQESDYSYSYFHLIMIHGLIFWGNSYHSNIIFWLQKIIRITMEIWDRDSCRKYFRELKLLLLKTQYVYKLALFVVIKRHHFKDNSEIHNVNIKMKLELHHPSSHLAVHQNGTNNYNTTANNNNNYNTCPIIQNNLNWHSEISCIPIHSLCWTIFYIQAEVLFS